MPWTKVFLDKEEAERHLVQQGLRTRTCREAILEAQCSAMERDGRVFVIGEGVADPGAVFGTAAGLVDRFGPSRVIDTPIAETVLAGVTLGSAIAGMHPVYVHLRTDFLPMCMDQLINHAAKWCYMTGGRVPAPMVVRAIIGRGWGSAAQHAQALHPLFTHIPGLKVAMPATPYDAKGLFLAAIEDANPVILFEHRWTFEAIGHVPAEDYTVPFGKGVIRRPGTDVTIVAFSQMLYDALKAAAILEKEGIHVEVIDPRTLKPLDEDLILESVAKTSRLVVAEGAHRTGSVAAEVACRVCERDPSLLKAPVRRITFPDTPIPCSSVLESAFYPGAAHIVDAARSLMG